MATFGRLLDGKWLDVTTGPDLATVQLRFPFPITSCPATDTNGEPLRHGAVDNGNGTATNPVIVVTLTPAILSASGFQETCETGFGGGTVGATRFGAVMRALASSADDLVFSINQRFVKSTTFDKTKTAFALAVLQNKTIITAGERTAIIAAWPNG